jgi:hypothetical protein
MNYLDSAFSQLELAIKLMHAAEQGIIRREEIDIPLTIREGNSILVLADQVIHTDADFINAFQNSVSVAFGAAAITLNRCREDVGLSLPNPINTETEQWVALVYQIRNAFAHDIAEPKWKIKSQYARRHYQVGTVEVDLTALHEQHFDYYQLGGPEALFLLKDYGRRYAFI